MKVAIRLRSIHLPRKGANLAYENYLRRYKAIFILCRS